MGSKHHHDREARLWDEFEGSEAGSKAEALLHLGVFYFKHEDLERAAVLLEEAIALFVQYTATTSDQDLLVALSCLGSTYEGLDRYQDAADKFLQARELALVLKDKTVSLMTHNHARMLFELGHFDLAAAMHAEVLTFYPPGTDTYEIGVDLANIALCNMRLGNTETAIDLYQQAQAQFIKCDKPNFAARCDQELVSLYVGSSQPESALSAAKRLLAFADFSGDDEMKQDANRQMAKALTELSHIDLAQEHLMTARNLLLGASQPDWAAVVEVDQLMASNFEQLGDATNANLIRERLQNITYYINSEDKDLSKQ